MLLGDNTAANAVESVLHALASCLSVGIAYNAAAQGIQIQELTFDLDGDLDLHGFLGLSEQVRAGYEGIRITCHIKSDAPREKLDELVAYVERTSPVLDIVRNPTSVDVQVS